MSKSQDYLASGDVVPNPADPTTVILNVPLIITIAAVDAEAFEIVAGAAGWYPNVSMPSYSKDETGYDVVTQNIVPNPVSAAQFCVQGMKNYATQQLQQALTQKNLADALALTQQQMATLVPA